MKKFISVLIVLFGITSIALAKSKNENLGLVSQLVEIKFVSESYLENTLAMSIPEGFKITSIQRYNLLRIQIDKLIYQLIADLRAKNSIRKFKLLNRYYKVHSLAESHPIKKSLVQYSKALAEINNAYINFISKKDGSHINIEAIMGNPNQTWTIAKDLSKTKRKKVEGIVQILNNLRLKPASELQPKKNDVQ